MKYKLFTDGGSRGNPGDSACAFFIFEENSLFDFGGTFLGTTTNNSAEYQGLILGLENLLEHNILSAECFLDSELVVKQLNGEYKVKNEDMKVLYLEIVKLRKFLKEISFTHIKRELNKHADKLVNIILDETKKNL